MKLIIRLLAGIAILLVLSCGRRTAPQPYSIPIDSLPVIKLARINYTGADIVVKWKLQKSAENDDSDNDLKFYDINFLRQNVNCVLCEPAILGKIRIDIKKGTWVIHQLKEDGLLGRIKYNGGRGDNTVTIPGPFVEAYLDKKQFYMTVSYVTKKGLSSFPSGRLIPIRPLTIPKPVISVRKLVTPQNKAEAKEYFFVLSWEPRQEIIRHVIQESGKKTEIKLFYGVNLYRVDKKDENGVEWLLNPIPSVSGSLSMSGFHDFLYASHVDRYGNESEKVLIFDGNYD